MASLPPLDAESIRARLTHAASTTIPAIMAATGAVGLSLGVMLGSEVVFTSHHGLRDAEAGLAPDDNTIYPLCSVSKPMVSSLLGILASEANFKFSDKLADILPSYQPKDEALRDIKFEDWLSMRSGAQPYFYPIQADNTIIFLKNDAMRIVNSLKSVNPRGEFEYNNWGYQLAAEVIEHTTGKPWDEVLHERILEPLGIGRVDATGRFCSDDGEENGGGNVARGYFARDGADEPAARIPRLKCCGRTIFGAAGGIRGSLVDTMRVYRAILSAAQDEFFAEEKIQHENGAHEKNTIFRNLRTTMAPHTFIKPDGFLRPVSYGLGWFRSDLPNHRLRVGFNVALTGVGPMLGGDPHPRAKAGETKTTTVGWEHQVMIGHAGANPGALCGIATFPETDVIVLVLANTMTRGDVADWVLCEVIQTVFDFARKNDYVEWATRTADEKRKLYGKLAGDVESFATGDGDKEERPLGDYEGEYLNEAGFFAVRMQVREDGHLWMRLNGFETLWWRMKRLAGDVFSWLPEKETMLARGASVHKPAEFFIIKFGCVESGHGGGIGRFVWVNDGCLPEGEAFVRR